MIIGRFAQDSTYATSAGIDYEAGSFTILGAGPTTIAHVISLDQQGEIIWSSQETRTWFYDAFAAPPTASTATNRPASGPVDAALAVATYAKPEKRGPKTWQWVVGLVGLLVLCGLVGTLSKPPSSTTPAVTPAPASSEAPAQQPTAETPAVEAPPPAPAPAPKPKSWQNVTTFSGSGKKRSPTFPLTGADARMKYEASGSGSLIFSAYIVAQGDSLEKSGGFPEVMVTKSGSDSTMLAKDAGDYYLDVNSANCDWTITIEELK